MKNPIHGQEYLCYYAGEYLGTAIFEDDSFIGDFIMRVIDKDRGLVEISLLPDTWVLKTEAVAPHDLSPKVNHKIKNL